MNDHANEPRTTEVSLQSHKMLITGVSRSMGIGAAITKRCATAGACVAVHGYSEYDKALEYPDANHEANNELAKSLGNEGARIEVLPQSDLSDANVPEQIVAQAAEKLAGLDGLVLNHAYSVHADLDAWTAKHIDTHFNVNVRATMLLIQAFAKQCNKEQGGVITLFTSGQYLGPMTNEIAYAVSKEAICGLTKQVAHALASENIRVNCINPGPTDTGYLEGEAYDKVKQQFPSGRWGAPDDAAKLVQFLHSGNAKWITGQVIASEGGFQR
jgi:3-oxoacyl-[acyl-carrier protein] reductase